MHYYCSWNCCLSLSVCQAIAAFFCWTMPYLYRAFPGSDSSACSCMLPINLISSFITSVPLSNFVPSALLETETWYVLRLYHFFLWRFAYSDRMGIQGPNCVNNRRKRQVICLLDVNMIQPSWASLGFDGQQTAIHLESTMHSVPCTAPNNEIQ